MNRREALQALVALPAVKSVAVADVKPTDVIVIESTDLLSKEHMERIRSEVTTIWPKNKVLVLSHELHMTIAKDLA